MGLRSRAVAARMADIGARGLLSDLIGSLPDGFLEDLFGQLILNLFNCEQPTDGDDVKATVERHHKTSGRYDVRFFGRVARSARQVARRDDDPNTSLTRKQSHSVAKVFLDDIRTGDAQELSLVVFELKSAA